MRKFLISVESNLRAFRNSFYFPFLGPQIAVAGFQGVHSHSQLRDANTVQDLLTGVWHMGVPKSRVSA